MKRVEIWHTLFSGKAAIEIDSPLGKPLRLFKVTLLSQVLFLGCSVPLSVHPRLVSKVIELEPFSTIAGIEQIAISQDNTIVAVQASDGPLGLFKLPSGQNLGSVQKNTRYGSLTPFEFSYDNRTLARASINNDRELVLWDVLNQRIIRVLKSHKDSIVAIAFSKRPGLIATASADRTVKIWSQKEGKLQREFSTSGQLCKLEFSLNAKTLSAMTCKGSFQRWDLQTGQLLQTLSIPAKQQDAYWQPTTIDFLEDHQLAATITNDMNVSLWNLTTGKQLKAISSNDRGFLSVALSKDGKLLATVSLSKSTDLLTGGNYHTIKIWDVESGQVLSQSRENEEAITMQFTSDSKQLVTAGAPGQISLWDISQFR
jgi:WD40 repeat protein